ncbi:MAG: hypothetical protein NC433_02990 [Clostridiales bacterium]|nr:hypothetical protein [Clostridiales bacterium]
MEKVLINGTEYTSLNVEIPLLLNCNQLGILENSYKRYSDACTADGCPCDDSIENYLSLHILSSILNINLEKFLRELS